MSAPSAGRHAVLPRRSRPNGLRPGSRFLFAAGLLSATAACQDPTGPVLGDWRGNQPALNSFYQRTTELILDGTPAATTGTYHLIRLTQDPTFGAGSGRFLRWADRWTRETVRDTQGAPHDGFRLRNAPGAEPSLYVLTADQLLVPVYNEQHPDLSPAARRIALYPLPRTSWGYGRP